MWNIAPKRHAQVTDTKSTQMCLPIMEVAFPNGGSW